MEASLEGEKDMTRLLILSVFAATCFGMVAIGQDLVDKDKVMALNPLVGSAVQPSTSVTIYNSSPSRFFGNLLNERTGSLEVGMKYGVAESKVVPSFDGSQLWVRVEPLSAGTNPDSECLASSCWSYFGVVTQNANGWASENAQSNFEIVIENAM